MMNSAQTVQICNLKHSMYLANANMLMLKHVKDAPETKT